ncbi:ribonuclease H-like domain-containing protein [Mycena alexandri]|uniref:Ribonuclease H-like domain-containing protein n=1 Tax=Mycena alexandri TaxID=1745969 RepID=A0AAD6SWA7_9AGAR|nr:ribonuclease H-like domain-containing protein [Mycena alexandri]
MFYPQYIAALRTPPSPSAKSQHLERTTIRPTYQDTAPYSVAAPSSAFVPGPNTGLLPLHIHLCRHKDFLERCFPSLRDGVIRVEKYSHLPTLEIPPDVSICVIKSVDEINTAMRTIIQDIPDNSNQQKIVIFLDSEWNVEISDRGYLTGRGQTAILQIAYKKMVYIIQLGAMIAGGQIASVLTQVLESPQILNVGRAVSGDLKYLQQATSSSKPFVGAVDLAKMAKDRLVISNSKIGLADLCAVSLGLRLDKNVPEHISSAWSNEDLSSAQIRYAALDVHACSRIYDFLSGIPIPALLRSSVEIGTPILLFNDDHTRLIARGSIEQLTGSFDTGKTRRDGTSDIIDISASRCLVQISEVVVPAAILKLHKQALSLFGSPPFSAVCLRNHLRLASPVALPQISVVGTTKETLNPPAPSTDLEINTPGTSNVLPELSS